MMVLEANIEYEFLIKTPIVGLAIASLPQTATEELVNNDINDEEVDSGIETDDNENNNDDGTETVTNVEDLFN